MTAPHLKLLRDAGDAPVPANKPVQDDAPRNCVTRIPCVGGNSVALVGWDGGGNPWCRMELSLRAVDEDQVRMWERCIATQSKPMGDLLAPRALFAPGPRLL